MGRKKEKFLPDINKKKKVNGPQSRKYKKSSIRKPQNSNHLARNIKSLDQKKSGSYASQNNHTSVNKNMFRRKIQRTEKKAPHRLTSKPTSSCTYQFGSRGSESMGIHRKDTQESMDQRIVNGKAVRKNRKSQSLLRTQKTQSKRKSEIHESSKNFYEDNQSP